MPFDPDKYLKSKTTFDPDSYLRSRGVKEARQRFAQPMSEFGIEERYNEQEITPVPSKSTFIPQEQVFAQPYQSLAEKALGKNAGYVRPLTKALDFVASPVIGAAQSAGRNIKRSIENISEAGYQNIGGVPVFTNPEKALTGALQAALVPVELGAGAFGATPAGAAFNIGVGTAQEIPVVKDVVETALTPAQRAFKPESELGQAAAGLTDAAVNLYLLKKTGDVAGKLQERVSPEPMLKAETKTIGVKQEPVEDVVIPQERILQSKTVKEFDTIEQAKTYAQEINGAYTTNGNKFVAGDVSELSNLYRSPKEAKILPFKEQVKTDLPPEVLVVIPQFKNTNEAIAFGARATPEQVTALESKLAETDARLRELQKNPTKENRQQRIDVASERQFYNEALQTAKEPTKLREFEKPAVKQPYEMTKIDKALEIIEGKEKTKQKPSTEEQPKILKNKVTGSQFSGSTWEEFTNRITDYFLPKFNKPITLEKRSNVLMENFSSKYGKEDIQKLIKDYDENGGQISITTSDKGRNFKTVLPDEVAKYFINKMRESSDLKWKSSAPLARNPKTLVEEMSSLADYNKREQAEWLGSGTKYATPIPAEGKLKIYRATPEGFEIQSGDYVTTSKKYAEEHIKNNLGGKGKITEKIVSLNELYPADAPNEFWYAENLKGKKEGGGAVASGNMSKVPVSMEPKQQPVKASEIISTVSKMLNIPTRIGKYRTRVMGQKAAGIFKPHAEVVRLQEANDIATFSHEIAHAIDKTVLGGLKGTARNAHFKKWSVELKNLDYDQKKRREYEGFAEFVRHYLTDDDAATIAPQFYDYFTNDFLKNNPATASVINYAKKQITAWREQGALNRVLSQIDFDGKTQKPTLGERFTEAKLKAQAAWTNRLAPLNYAVNEMTKGEKLRASEDPAQLAKMVNKTAGTKAREYVMNGAFDFTGQKVGKSLKEIVEPVSDNIQEALAYAYAKRAVELSKRDINAGISKADAEYILKKYTSPKNETFVKEITDWMGSVMDYLVDAGGLSPEAAAKIRESNLVYIPLKRVFEEQTSLGGIGKGFTDLPSPIRKIKGSGREIINPLESMIAQVEQIISVADKARVARALVDVAEKYEGTGKWVEKLPAPIEVKKAKLDELQKQITEAGGDLSNADLEAVINMFSQARQYYGKDNIVSVLKNGKREYYQVNPLIYESLKGMDKLTLPYALDLVFGKATRMVRLGSTGIQAGFSLITNPIRDIQTSALQSDYVGVRPDRAVRAIGEELIGRSEFAKMFRRAGGEMAQPLGMDRKVLQDAVNEVLANDTKSKALNVAKHPIEALRKILSFPEAGSRLAEFEAVMKKYQPKIDEALSRGDNVIAKKLREDAIVEASNAAAEVTVDFRRAGKYAEILNQIIPFFNPAIQGISKVGRTIAAHPVRTGMRGTMILTAPTLALWYMNKDEDWYKELPPWQKYMFWNFRVGEEIIRLPKPFDWGYLFSALPEATIDAMYQKDPQQIENAFKAIASQTLPDVMPAVVKPAAEAYFNWDMFRERPIVSRSQEDLLPEAQYTPNTSEVSKKIGEILKISPAKIDHILSGYTGGLANDILNVTSKEIKEKADIPVIGRLFTRQFTTGFGGESVQKFYDSYDKLQRVIKTASASQKHTELQTMKLDNEQRNILQYKDFINGVAGQLIELRSAQRKIGQMNIDKGVKAKLNQSIEQAAAMLARNANIIIGFEAKTKVSASK